ncbi:integrase [Streptomyces sp. B6B3]|uniref:integrase n=1 Tax=Streptomyces sp. B6B3 TaxID=3153570 RepID=UPI00325C3813
MFPVDDRRPDPRVNLYFRNSRIASRQPSTWRRYAYSLAVWLGFLDSIGIAWDEATGEDYTDFKFWRITDFRNDERVQPTSFDTDRAALNSFYSWAGPLYGCANPVAPGYTLRPADPGDIAPAQGRRDPARPAGSTRRRVKWLLRGAFEQWRDIGFRGYGFDGLRAEGWRGANEDRDCAFVDGLYGTGLRLAEWGSVLDVELPSLEMAGRFPRALLARACTKGKRDGREYRVPAGVVSSLNGYLDRVEGSRAEAIRRARRAGRYDRIPGMKIVTGLSPRARTLTILTDQGSTTRSMDSLEPEERLLLFRPTDDGLEPLAVWLGVNGLPMRAHSWQKRFAEANKRVAAAWRHAGGRRAVPLFCRPHMCRHSFALRWFSILSLVWNQRVEGFTDAELREFRDQFGDVWFQLAGLLGHANPQMTRDWYLEPFTALETDYLMALLDEEEHAAVSRLAERIGATSDRVLRRVGPAGTAVRPAEGRP